MKIRFVLLGIISGVFMIVSLPVGILFFVFVYIYYLKSRTRDDYIVEEYPDFKKLLGSRDYCNVQEDMK